MYRRTGTAPLFVAFPESDRKAADYSNVIRRTFEVYYCLLLLPYALTSPQVASSHLISLLASRLMGNDTSYQVQRYPMLAFEASSRHSETAASLPDSLAFCARQEDFIRRQESLPSEADYTDSSDNSIISRRRRFPGANSNNNINPIVPSSWLRTTPGTCGTPSSEKGSLLDVLVKRISGGGQNQTSSSDEDQTGGTRDLSSMTSLQDSACEFLESSQQLTEEEKAQIKGVLDRLKQVESREAKRISNLELELQQREAEVARGVVRSAQDIYGSVSGCNLCDSSAALEEMEEKDAKFRQCSDCERRICHNCSFIICQSDSKDPRVICSLCRRKRRLIATSGAWTQGVSLGADELLSLSIPRAHSYGGYGDFYDTKSVYSRWKANEKRLSTPKITFTNLFKRPDSMHQTQDVLLPTITVDSPKSLQFPDLIAAQKDPHLQRPQHTVNDFDDEENLPSSDGECPDTEGVKSLFLPNRIPPLPVSSIREPSSVDFDNHMHLPYTDEMMAVYYGDPWAYYRREMVEAENVDDTVEKDHGEGLQLDDPPFEPISEEGEEEIGEVQQSFSDTSVTTTTPSTFEGSKSPPKPISRHPSLEKIPKTRRMLEHSYSYPFLVTLAPGKNIFLPKVPKDMEDFVRCETLSPLKGGLHLDPVLVHGETDLQRVNVDNPPEIFMDTPLQHDYVATNWNHSSPLEEESVRIIVADDDEEEDEDEDGDVLEDGEVKSEEQSGLSQIRRCQHFENINQLIATVGSPLYPVMEEENGVESDPCLNSPVISDGQTIHRWGREISQTAPSALDITQSFTLTPYAADQVLIKQEEQLWASLFAPSESAVVESAKGFTAQLQEMSQLVEVTADEVMKELNLTSLKKEVQERVGNIDVISLKEVSSGVK
ncbi:hypothetical protein TcWFU_000336 [Taenia crassiceps]|uniref:RabBD domain-containing protein n=1 Tax=Taenia crassiceps TaxID=6207 RepID=A0ABR4QQ04_9CEST